MAKRKDYQLAATNTFAVEEDTHELLLKSMGISTSPGILAKEKLIAIDPTTKALLVKWIDSIPFAERKQITLTDDASIALETVIPSTIGILFLLTDDGNCAGAVFIRGGINAVTELLDAQTNIAQADIDTELCIISDGDGTYTLKNRLGMSRDITLMFLGK